MSKVKKEQNMDVTSYQLPPLPIGKEDKRLVQAEVKQELFDAVNKEMKRRKQKIRQVLEWGLEAYLLKSNPKAAATLGIAPEEE